jgi:pimeloyl-ACP methyl ester carboxylesterase
MSLVWIAAMLGALVAAVLLLLAGGFAFQLIAERMDRQRDPPPGRLIDVGGRRLHLVCAGNAAGPTVVIEAGSGNDSNSWRAIVERVGRFAAVCAYDRAGLGWSDPAPRPRSFADRAADLHSVLVAGSVAPPYVLVGHSYGGYIVRLFARDHAGQVAGIVLVDASEEGFAFAPAGRAGARRLRTRMLRLALAARFGVLRLIAALLPERFKAIKGGLPATYAGPASLYLRTARYQEAADEMAAYESVPPAMTRPGGFGSLGELPLSVISRTPGDPVTGQPTAPEWQEAQLRLLRLSGRSVHIVASRSGHTIQDSEPDLVAGAIAQMLRSLGGAPPS